MWANFCLSITNKIDGEIVRNYLVVDKKFSTLLPPSPTLLDAGRNNKFQLAEAWLILKFQKIQRETECGRGRKREGVRKMSASELKVKLTEN